jgi:hypothetical protein
MGELQSDYQKELDYIRTKAIYDSLTKWPSENEAVTRGFAAGDSFVLTGPKYRFYFSGLVFAILSYSIQKPNYLWCVRRPER